MASIFEELMGHNQKLTEGVVPVKREPKKECTNCRKKIKASKFKFESRRILEDDEADYDELDKQFSVDPEESEEDEVVLVIDPELDPNEEVPEDASENLIGDLVYKCPICGANYVCDCEAENPVVELDEEGVPVECPICGEDESEQILVGEIAPVDEVAAGDEQEMPMQDIPEEGEETEESEEETEEESEGEEDLEIEDEEEEKEEEKEEESLKKSSKNFYFDDKRFESFMNDLLKENYKGDLSFKLLSTTYANKKLNLEYVISGSKRKDIRGTLVAEGLDFTARTMRLRIKDNKQFESLRSNPAFLVDCITIKNKIIPVRMRYNYVRKVNEQLYRIAGSYGFDKK